ncbi:MAG: PcfJ domain-containing protein [Bacillota bacterium]
MKERLIAEYLKHADLTLTKGISEYAINVALMKSRYVFVRKEGKQQFGYCTHCNREYPTEKLKHNSTYFCPHCGSFTTVKASGMHRKSLIDYAYFVFFEKSLISKDVIIAKGISVNRNYSGSYRNVETKYSLDFLYIFEPGNAVMLKWQWWRKTWALAGKVYSYFGHDSLANPQMIQLCSHKSVKAAIAGTPFQYSAVEMFVRTDDSIDAVEYLALYAKYPSVEYIMKLGFKNLIIAKLSRGNTYSAINWKGTTLFKVLKINKKDLKEIKDQGVNISFLFLKLLQISRKDKSNLSIKQLDEIAITYDTHFKELQHVLKFSTLERAYNYLNKQSTVVKSALRYRWDILIAWKDYISDCIDLGWDLTDDNIIYPKNIHETHQNTIRQMKIKADESLNKKIKKRLKALNKQYYYESMGLMIRPAQSSIELLDEGKALNHCVGRYAESYAKGATNILLIRKLSEPDKPYFTLELRKDKIIQVRGLRNCPPDKLVESFVSEFTDQKLRKEEVKPRVMIPA